ncbi:protein adenylyltransferase SelO [Neokomagataea anthophila]|uniref:Protein nucleotidyltransferase YdiU n=1 Tax=Neokomagataea anthophila TaxID=2826925 RepID=A0ABS5E492_9PROT|nr:YdiU family protein [Neokomagataea anthophila]MBR0558716.1 YdiU family protein [Neokomagataea anthophila]
MQFSHDYALLPEHFSAKIAPKYSPPPSQLITLNTPWAEALGLSPTWLHTPEGKDLLTHGITPDGHLPIAMAYAGHQFGHFVPSLGDGRAVLVGELTTKNGQKHDLHLKGWGRTPFSRNGDGKAALGPVLREMLISEAMAAFDIPTTRSLAATLTGETVQRDTALPGAVLARTARSHVRIGTFQYFAARQDHEALAVLLDHVITRLYPDLTNTPNKALALLQTVIHKHAQLVAQWLHIGFVHGVMNTDNMSIAGETIDYGPCAFLDAYDPEACFSFIDRGKRYAYGNQPDMALWNLGRFAECLLPLIHSDDNMAVEQATACLKDFDRVFSEHYLTGWRKKLGLFTEAPADTRLIAQLLDIMHRQQLDFTQSFRALNTTIRTQNPEPFLALCSDRDAGQHWYTQWQKRIAQEAISQDDRFNAMQRVNPRIIPRNHLVEHAINAAYDGDFKPFEHLQKALRTPYHDADDSFYAPPRPEERVLHTFCGT